MNICAENRGDLSNKTFNYCAKATLYMLKIKRRNQKKVIR